MYMHQIVAVNVNERSHDNFNYDSSFYSVLFDSQARASHSVEVKVSQQELLINHSEIMANIYKATCG